MKFIVDARLPFALSKFLHQHGFDSLHTIELPNKNATDDREVNALSVREQRIVVTKDKEFLESYILQGIPWKLLLVSTGNVGNLELFEMFDSRITQLKTLFKKHYVVELNKQMIVTHF